MNKPLVPIIAPMIVLGTYKWTVSIATGAFCNICECCCGCWWGIFPFAYGFGWEGINGPDDG